MNKLFLAAINQLCIERNLSREEVIEAVTSAIRTAFRKDFSMETEEQNIKVTINDDSGEIRVYLVKTVVKKVEDKDTEISLAQAQTINSKAKLGDSVEIDVTPDSFGRIAAQAAKQVILQKMHEKEREHMYEHFKERENELVNSQVHRVEGRSVYLEIEKNIVLLPKEEQIPGENYYNGKRLKVYLDKVIREGKGPRLLISRSHPNLVSELFKQEIPEVREGIIEIVSVSRTAGMRTKIAVKSNDEKVDPVGACVGQKGVRIKSIISEVSGEMIDIVPYSEDPVAFIKSALSPAQVESVKLNKDRKEAIAYVDDSMRPQAIGKKGQNVYLAGELTGWNINIESTGAKSEDTEKVEISAEMMEGKVSELPLADSIKDKLIKAGIEDVAVLAKLSKDDLTKIGGIGAKTADEIVAALSVSEEA